jgi:hypothetical protein
VLQKLLAKQSVSVVHSPGQVPLFPEHEAPEEQGGFPAVPAGRRVQEPSDEAPSVPEQTSQLPLQG